MAYAPVHLSEASWSMKNDLEGHNWPTKWISPNSWATTTPQNDKSMQTRGLGNWIKEMLWVQYAISITFTSTHSIPTFHQSSLFERMNVASTTPQFRSVGNDNNTTPEPDSAANNDNLSATSCSSRPHNTSSGNHSNDLEKKGDQKKPITFSSGC